MSSEKWHRKRTLTKLVPILNSSKAEEVIEGMSQDGSYGVLKVIDSNDYQIRQDRIPEFLNQVPGLRRKEARRVLLMCGLPVHSLA